MVLTTVCILAVLAASVGGQEMDPDGHRPQSCEDVKQYDVYSGVHTLFVDNNTPFDVFCDQDSDDGGWTVIQRRIDGSVNFNRSWQDYEQGFGDPHGEYWLGLSKIHLLAGRYSQQSLLVQIEDFDDPGYIISAQYDDFAVWGPETNYSLRVSGITYESYAGDCLGEQTDVVGGQAHGMQFSTYDRDNDNWDAVNCALKTSSGWWHNQCFCTSPNGPYHPGGGVHSEDDGMSWHHYHDDWRSYKSITMKIRSKYF